MEKLPQADVWTWSAFQYENYFENSQYLLKIEYSWTIKVLLLL